MSDATTTCTASDREADAHQIAGQLALIQWIESARTTLHWINEHRQLSPALDEALTARDVRQALPWADRESAGLHYLVDDVARLVGKLAV